MTKPRVVEKDMATTLPEFFRLLPRFVGGCDHAMRDDGVEIGTPERRIVISAKALEPRIIASLVLDRCRVELVFTGFEDGEIADFLTRFDRVYQKGGG